MQTINDKDRSQSFELVWKRPEGRPRVWCAFEGRRKLENGTLPNFIIQEITEEMFEDVLDHMVNYCFTDEPTFANVGLVNDPLGRQEVRSFVKCYLLQGISIATLLVDTDPTVKPLIVGVNVLYINTSEDHGMVDYIEHLKSKTLKKILRVAIGLDKEFNVFEEFEVDKYFTSFGLSVQRSFRGHGLGQKMLELREEIGRTYEVPVTVTVFSAIESQILAHRTGFQILSQKKFSEILDWEGKIAFPGIPVEYIKVMGKKLY